MTGKHGGARAGAGRKPGKVSKAKIALSAKAKEHAEDALKVLLDVAKDDQQPAAARVSAATAILDRGYGKPPQALEVGGPDGGPVQVQTLSDFYGGLGGNK